MFIQRYYARALEAGRRDGKGGLSPRSVRYHHAVLREALKHAVKWRLIPVNPADAAEPPKPKRPQVKALGPHDIARILETADALHHRDRYLIRAAVYTGMRQGELLALRRDDVGLEAGTIYVRQALQRIPGEGHSFKEPKTEKGRRATAMPTLLVETLLAVQAEQPQNRKMIAEIGYPYHDHGLVFCNSDGKPLDRCGVTRRFKTLAARAGFPDVTFHALRHSHATVLLAQGVHPKVVQERLGHSTISITMDTYSHVLPGLQEEAACKLDSAFGQPLGNREAKTRPDRRVH
jgi:integrase